MVRLRQSIKKALIGFDTLFQFLMVRLRLMKEDFYVIAEIFQFLMVRLRLIGHLYGKSRYVISIPYGTIKTESVY